MPRKIEPDVRALREAEPMVAALCELMLELAGAAARRPGQPMDGMVWDAKRTQEMRLIHAVAVGLRVNRGRT